MCIIYGGEEGVSWESGVRAESDFGLGRQVRRVAGKTGVTFLIDSLVFVCGVECCISIWGRVFIGLHPNYCYGF